MFCNQCDQTPDGTGCIEIGVCGKDPDVQSLQEILLYLDMVGKIHAPMAGNQEIDVPLVKMNALIGLLADILTEVVLELPLDAATSRRTLRSFHKLIWS